MNRLSTALLTLLLISSTVLSGCSDSSSPMSAIPSTYSSKGFTPEKLNRLADPGEFENVASLRGLLAFGGGRYSCSGSLLAKDHEKFVLLTAAHCTDGWLSVEDQLESVGVSFLADNNKGQAPPFPDVSDYLRGGVPISLPAKDAPFEKLDYGMVVFPINATSNSGLLGASELHDVVPVNLPNDTEYVGELISSVNNPQNNLEFFSVGYGIGEFLPGGFHDLSTFLVRDVAEGMTYNAYNPGNDVLRLSMNANKGEGFTCNGDSGSPVFFDDEGQFVVVSLVSGGDAPCKATNTGPAFGDQRVFDFLGCATVSGNADAVKACVAAIFEH